MADDLSRVSRPTSRAVNRAFIRTIHTFDEYRNMRLNTDDMSYEDLLALGERMGQVCTGIPKEKIAMCLIVNEFSDHKQKRSCAICLEEYKIKDEIGVLNNCGHEYHTSCISKWLLMKKTCPICRRDAFDPPKND